MEDFDAFLDRYYSSWRAYDAAYDAWGAKFGLSYTELLILYSFREAGGGGCTQSDICRQWYMPKQTVNSALKLLERQGYVALSSSKADRRSKTAALTEAGRDLAERAIGELKRAEERAAVRMGEEEFRAMVRYAERFVELLRADIGVDD